MQVWMSARINPAKGHRSIGRVQLGAVKFKRRSFQEEMHAKAEHFD